MPFRISERWYHALVVGKISGNTSEAESEASAQTRFVAFLDECKDSGSVLAYTSIPNSTRTPYHGVRIANIRQWLRKWLPDLVIVYKSDWWRVRTAWIEMKKEKRWVVSPEQEEWIRILNHSEWTSAHIARWYDEAVGTIRRLISDR